MTVRGYQLGIDWSRSGAYNGVLEDVSSYLLADSDLEVSWGRETSQAGTAATAASMDIELRNDGRWFSPDNPSSPIAGRILPGTPARLTATAPGGQIHTLLAGVVDTLDVDPTAPAKTFTAEILDAWGRPDAEKLSTPLHQGIRTGAAIGLVLDAIGWTGGRDLDAGASVLPYWWLEDVDAPTAIEQLVACEGAPAIAYVQGGVFTFRDRHHRVLRGASTTSQASFTGALSSAGPVGALKIDRARGMRHGLADIANTVTWEIEQRQPGDVVEVWSTDTPISLAAGEQITIVAQAGDPFRDAVAELTADVGTATAALSRTSGQSTAITITAGGSATLVSRLALRAVSLPVARTVKVGASDPGSVATFGRREWPGPTPALVNALDAQAIATRLVAAYARPRPTVTIEIANISDAYLTQILTRAISDRITVRDDDLGVDADFIIERVTHRIRKLGAVHRVRWVCQTPDPTQPAAALTFDVAGRGFNDGRFAVEGIDSGSAVFRFDTAGQGFNDGRFGS